MFCFEEFKYSSSCISKCNSFYLIIRGGVMSFLTIWVRFSWFPCCQQWDILNLPISSLDLSCVMFHLKPSLRNVANCGVYQWSKFSPILSTNEIIISSLISSKQLFSYLAEFHLKFWDVFISPQAAYCFRCWSFNNSVQSFF